MMWFERLVFPDVGITGILNASGLEPFRSQSAEESATLLVAALQSALDGHRSETKSARK